MNWYQIAQTSENIPLNNNFNLLLLSYGIATLSAYVSFDMCLHLRRRASLLFRITWLIGSAIVMGVGVASMDLVNLLEFNTVIKMSITYDLLYISLSFLIAILASGIAFYLFMIKKPLLRDYIISGIILGVGFSVMHRISLQGINNVVIHYLPEVYSLSIFFIIIMNIIAFWFVIQSDQLSNRGSFGKQGFLKYMSAFMLGIGITGMHYFAIASAVFSPFPKIRFAYVIDQTELSTLIATIITTILLIAIILSTARYFINVARQQREFLAAILNNMGEGLIICDAVGKITSFNRTADNIHGPFPLLKPIKEWSKKFPLYGAGSNQFLEEKDNPLFRVLEEEQIRDIEVVSRDKYGDDRTLLLYGQLLHGTEGEKIGSVIVYRDITERKKLEASLIHQATHDSLTLLPNRALLIDRINQAIALGRRRNLKVIIIFIDLDNFKFVNDSLGHRIGDELLRVIVGRINVILRQSDTLARIGGDELVIILPHQEDIVYVYGLLDRILKEISAPISIENHLLQITGSLGISVFPDDGMNAETLLKNADTAMYQAKKRGRDNFQFFTKEMDLHVRNRLELENGLRNAIANNELRVFYQPKLNIKTNKIMGVEALLRWQHPKRGLICPKDFIHIAEETGIIISIGEWVIRMACKQGKIWQQEGFPPIIISVNLSTRQCKDLTLIQSISNILNETGLDPEYLELEVTESLAVEDPEDFLKILHELKALGIKLSIDDFGSGYSSLNYLRYFPVDYLKIDQTFINELQEGSNESTIVKAIIALGHGLNLKVIAEGVETEEQLSQLKAINCDDIQGFYFSQPLSSAKIEELFQEKRGSFNKKL